MILSDSRRNEYIYKRRPLEGSTSPVLSSGSATDAVRALRRNDGGDEFYILLHGTIIDGLGYLNRLRSRAKTFNDMAERVLGGPHPFGFRAGLIALGKDEPFESATVRVSTCLGRTMAPGNKSLVDWGRIQGDDKTPVDFEDPRFPTGSPGGNILAAARSNFSTDGLDSGQLSHDASERIRSVSSSNPLNVAVVGGGVLGVCTAQQLARAGANVVLVTEGELASDASRRSLSWLNSAGIRSESYHRLRMAGIDRYHTLSAQHQGLDWLHFGGGLVWQAEDQAEEMRRRHRYELAYGYDSHLLNGDQIAAHTPGVDPAAIPPAGAIWHPGEGWVDLPSLIQFLVADFVQRGGQLVTNAGRCRIVTEAGTVAGVLGERGNRFAVEAAVLATGAAVPAMAAELGVTIPDASPISLLVTTKPVQHELTAVLHTPRASVRPTPDGALAVDSDWTTAMITRATDGSYGVPPATVEELLTEASTLLTGNPRLAADRCDIGLKPIPGDGEPVLGKIDDVAGLCVAFTHSGATLALIAGELLAYEMMRGTAHPMLADFNARRFAMTDAVTS